MKRSKLFLFVFAFASALVTFQGCNKCEETGEVNFDAATQNFSITYKDTAGNNMILNTFNLSNVSVLVADRLMNNPQYVPAPYNEDFTDGKIGPIPYTMIAMRDGSFGTALMGVPYSSEFVIKRDTFGWDTLRVDFVAQTDECKEYWAEITYYLNGDSIGSIQNTEAANIDITIP